MNEDTELAVIGAGARTDEDTAAETDELLIEEVSIDGMCGVY